MSGILENCIFVIDQYIPLKKKVELIRLIKTNSGISVYSVSEKSTHLITSQEGYNEGSAKVIAAKNLGLHIVSKEFVVDSIAQGAKQDETQYYFSNTGTLTTPTNSTPATPVTPATPPTPTVQITHSPALAQPHVTLSPHPTSPPPGLTVTIPTRPAIPSQLSASSPRSPPGFNNIRAPNLQPTHKKTNFGGLRVDVNRPDQQRSPLPSPSPRYAQADSDHFSPKLEARSSSEDEDEDEDEDESSEEDEGQTPKASFRDILEMSNKEANRRNDVNQPRTWEPAIPQYLEDDGCKIFVGGIMFDDLEALKKTKEGYTASAEVIAHIQKLKNERLLEIIRIFSRFGTVVRVKQFLEKRHIFITYDNKNSALLALRTLKPLEVRKKIVQEVRDRLRAEDRQTIVSPRSNFYVRWPHHVDSETDGYVSTPRSYFSGSSSSAPNSPTASSLPTQKLSWRQPQSPTSNYQPYQRSYFNNNNSNFSSGLASSRTTSMRSYFSHSESEYEGSNNPNSFSESESSHYSRNNRTQHYPTPRHNSDISSSSTLPPNQLSESDSDSAISSPGIRHRVVDRIHDKDEDSGPINSPSTISSDTAPSPSTQHVESPSPPTATTALLTPIQTTITPTYPREKRRAVNEEGNWHKVLVLLLVLASMIIVYLYSKVPSI